MTAKEATGRWINALRTALPLPVAVAIALWTGGFVVAGFKMQSDAVQESKQHTDRRVDELREDVRYIRDRIDKVLDRDR